ncbi:hypothetical protein KAK07_23730 [Ideonella sp. 4Y16]|uniref:Uncharacterized protein n=1 Tax=Ideonella alba TaxID=2824118 RepID=A0A941BNP5_9BURK|nr:hypothetical protein [Ideonella alba]MBQ0933559.1 hypothetical protein [Ideonella alba]MBQ0946369.1 hypothetical protein [Ideonella alba]
MLQSFSTRMQPADNNSNCVKFKPNQKILQSSRNSRRADSWKRSAKKVAGSDFFMQAAREFQG